MFIQGSVMSKMSLMHEFTGISVDLDVPNVSGEEQLKEQLQSGYIPNNLREEWELVDEDSPMGLSFQDYMTDVTKMLLQDAGEHEKADSLDIRFFLTNNLQPNAGIVTSANPKIMMVSRGFWDLVQTRDQAEGVIGHELGHADIFDELGEHKNSKGEETSSDLYGTNLLHRAGRNTEALKEFFILLDSDREEIPWSWSGYVDPHPNTNLRIRVLENAYEAIKENEGNYSTGSTLLPEDVRKEFSQFDYLTPIQRILEQNEYHSLDIDERYEWIMQNIAVVRSWDENGYKKRVHEFGRVVRELLADLERLKSNLDDQDKDLIGSKIEKLGNAILATGSIDFYEEITETKKPTSPPETLLELNRLISAFVNSTDLADIRRLSDQILSDIDAFPEEARGLLSKLEFNSFFIPEPEIINEAEANIFNELIESLEKDPNLDINQLLPILHQKHGHQMPWQTHIDAMIASGDSGKNIALAMRAVGVEDPRLVSYLDARSETSFDDENSLKIASPKYKDKLGYNYENGSVDYIRNCKVDENGYYVSTSTSSILNRRSGLSKDLTVKIEGINLAENAKLQRSALERIDFSLLETDFWGFVDAHQELLKPTVSVLSSQEPFYVAFIEKMDGLIASNPDAYKPLMYEFFSGRDFQNGSIIFSGDNRTTLPQILDNALIESKDELYDRTNKEFSGMPLGVDLSHPVIEFLLNDPHSLFSDNSEKIPVLDYARWQLKSSLEADDEIADIVDKRVFETFGFVQPSWEGMAADIEKYEELIVKLEKLQEEGQELEAESFCFSCENVNGIGYISILDLGLHELKLFNFLKNSDAVLDLQQTEFLLNHVKNFSGRVDEKFLPQIRRNAAFDLSDECSAEELIKKYILYEDAGALRGDPELRRTYQKRVIERFPEVNDINFRTQSAEHILLNHRNNGPNFKQALIDIWAEGKDNEFRAIDDPEILEKQFKSYIDALTGDNNIEDVLPMLTKLCEELRLQKDLSYYVEKRLQTNGLNMLPEKAIHGIFGEVIIDHVGRSPSFRAGLIDYLSKPETEQSTQSMRAVIDNEVPHAFRDDNGNLSGSITPEVKEDLIRLMHENYSSWPLEWQGVFLEKVLFPVNDELAFNNGETITIDGEAQIIFDRAFPPEKASSGIARDYIQCHLAELSPAGQRLYLAVIMATTKEKEADIGDDVSEMREVGRTLGRILGKMHPLGAKFVQEIESYPGTPAELREGLRDIDVKSGIDIPTRWDLWHMIERATAEDPSVIENHIVDEVLGGGSVQLNVAIRDTEFDDRSAMALLRDHVNQRADRQYEIFSNAFTNFIAKRPEFSEMRSILDSSYQNLKIETDYNLSRKQADNANKVYQDAHIVADDVVVDFSAVPFKKNGQRFKVYGMAEGQHFNDLPVETSRDITVKRSIAKAIVTRELVALLRGEAVDSDRHGKQQKILIYENEKGQIFAHVQNFDDGAMAVNPPSREEKRALGEVLGKTLSLSLDKGVPITDAILEVTQSYKNTQHSHYIETCKRGLRTIFGDYMNAEFTDDKGQSQRLVTNADVQDMFIAVMQDGKIDSNILYPAARQIGYSSLSSIHNKGVWASTRDILSSPLTAATKIFGLVSDRVARKIGREPSIVIKDGKNHLARLYMERRAEASSLSETFNIRAKNLASRVTTQTIVRGVQIFISNEPS